MYINSVYKTCSCLYNYHHYVFFSVYVNSC